MAQRDRMGVHPLLDEHCPPHGTWVGRSLGWVTVRGLTPSRSEAAHRLHPVPPWAKPRLQTRRGATGHRVHPLDRRDDRLAAVLEALREHERWQAFAGAVTQPRLRVDDLQAERVRLERTTASGDWRMTADGLCPFGQRTDHRPDLPQGKVMRSALEPRGWPVATAVVPGPRADAPLAVPAMPRVRSSLARRGRLSVGDGQRGAVETRACRQAGGADSWCPLSARHRPPHGWAGDVEPVARGPPPLTCSMRRTATGTRQHLADGDERPAPLPAAVAGHARVWTARRLGVRARHRARAGEAALRARWAKAPAARAARQDRGRGQRRGTALPALQAAVAALWARYRGPGLLAVPSTERVQTRRWRRSGRRPVTVPVARDRGVNAGVDRQAVATALGRLGWRV